MEAKDDAALTGDFSYKETPEITLLYSETEDETDPSETTDPSENTGDTGNNNNTGNQGNNNSNNNSAGKNGLPQMGSENTAIYALGGIALMAVGTMFFKNKKRASK